MNARHLSPQSLLRNAALAAVVALIVNVIIRVIAASAFDADTSTGPMTWGAIIAVTLGATAAATLVYWLLSRRYDEPAGIFRIVALVLLVLSLSGPLFSPDFDTASRVAGVLMHIVVGASVITLLPRSSTAEQPAES